MDDIRRYLHELESCFENLVAENAQLKERAYKGQKNENYGTLGEEAHREESLELPEEGRCDDSHFGLRYSPSFAQQKLRTVDEESVGLTVEANDDIKLERQPNDYDEDVTVDVPYGSNPAVRALSDPDVEHCRSYSPEQDDSQEALGLSSFSPGLWEITAHGSTEACGAGAEVQASKSLSPSLLDITARDSTQVSDAAELRASELRASRATRTSLSGQDFYQAVLPAWFQTGRRSSVGFQETSTTYDAMVKALTSQESTYTAVSCCVMSLFGTVRVTWDMIWRYVLALDIWATSIQVCFVPDDYSPYVLSVLEYFALSFFVIDIIMNFHTSIIKDKEEIFDKAQIALEYIKCWFWIDIAATMPWHLLLDLGGGGNTTQVARSIKIAKSVKTMKLIRVVKVWKYRKKEPAPGTQVAERMKKDLSEERIKSFRKLAKFLRLESIHGMFMILALVAHVNSCAFALMHPLWREPQDEQEVFKFYLESYCWAVTQLTFGSTYIAHLRIYLALEIATSFERILLCFFLVQHVVFRSLLAFEADGHNSIQQAEALTYLKEHDVSLDTQVQIMHYINETGQPRRRQRWFQQLMDNDLPGEMQSYLRQELWSAHLLSLGLIRQVSYMSSNFLSLLSHEVSEQVFPRHGIVCRDGDQSSCAYYVISGELIVLFMNQCDNGVPPFKPGMWVGEKALVNSELRRSGTVATKSAATLLVVPAREYRALLASAGLEHEFQQFCAEELWKGLCGRCGSVGEHWPSDCPTMGTSARWMFNHSGISTTFFAGDPDVEPPVSKFSQDLNIYIDYHNLPPRVFGILEDVGVFNLADLSAKEAAVQEALANKEVSASDLKIFTFKSIQKFKKVMAAKINDMLSTKMTANNHWLFFSHYKLEAGTEAALMRSEVLELIEEKEDHPAQVLDAPAYLDSEDLTDLHDLKKAVSRSHNVVLICTKNVLLRPWCLIEIATAMRENVPVLPLKLHKVGCEFDFPDEDFYENLQNGELIGQSGVELLAEHGFEMQEVCASIRKVFMRIALTYSPHRSAEIRKAEMAEFIKQCHFRDIKVQTTPPRNLLSANRNSVGVARHSVRSAVSGASLHPTNAFTELP